MKSLRLKVLAVLFAGFALGCGLLMLLTGVILTHDSLRLEESLARKDADRLQGAVHQMLLGLTRTALDWATWDESHDFITTGNPGFIAENLGDTVLLNLGASFMIFADREGRVVHVSLPGGAPGPTREEAARIVAACSPLRRGVARTPEGAAYGMVGNGPAPALFASASIVRSDGTGQPAGTLVIGKTWDRALSRQLAQTIGFPVALLSPDGSRAGTVVAPRGDTRLTVDTTFSAVDGEALFVARIERDREVLAQGRRGIRLFIGSIAVGGVAVLVLMSLFLDRLVLRPLAGITREVTAITASGDLTRRVAITGGDEIGRLGGATNAMLASLERGETALRESRQALADRIGELELAAARIDRLHKLLPICAQCKRVRSDGNYWHQIEHYLAENASMTFSHGVCPECAEAFRCDLVG